MLLSLLHETAISSPHSPMMNHMNGNKGKNFCKPNVTSYNLCFPSSGVENHKKGELDPLDANMLCMCGNHSVIRGVASLL